jgi:ubiquitin C-terminal hydrolase
MPVWRACGILGEPAVRNLVRKLLTLREKMLPGQDLMQELDDLVTSLFYKPRGSLNDEPPDDVVLCWKHWLTLKYLSLDKSTMLQFLVPYIVQPHPGPAGHMGLFDCLVYAIQLPASSSSASYYTQTQPAPVILIPDVLIVLAICKRYYDDRNLQALNQQENNIGLVNETGNQSKLDLESTSILDRIEQPNYDENSAVYQMARLAYRIYDSYQKKGSVARDTVHRFLTDVYGDNSYKEPRSEALLDIIFDDSAHATGWLGACVGEDQFCRRVMDTVDHKHTFVLLDWMATLICRMLPPEETPESVQAYIETRNRRPVPLCDAYALAENRLYEIKRRFHSMVQISTPVIQGDPMESMDANDEQHPKSAISKSSFIDAVVKENVEMGHGGYLPASLAELVFRVGCLAENAPRNDESKAIWTLYHVLHFGCTAVRLNAKAPEQRDLPLLRFIFSMFQLTGDGEIDDVDRTILTRDQIGRMVLLLIENLEYRQKADAPVGADEMSMPQEFRTELNDRLADSLVDPRALNLLALMPLNAKESDECVRLGEVIDMIMKDCVHPEQMVFDEFSTWKSKRAKTLNHLIVELRLIASVMFGVPPTEASLEVSIIGEIEARHKARYPQTDVSRRGPRGTLWYLIDSSWLRNWAALVKEVVNTEDDSKDGRDDTMGERVRGLKRINNRPLLIEGGGLSLRPDIRWKQDYEILPPLAWSAVHAWYDGGPPVHRSVVKYLQTGSTPHQTSKSRIPTENELELYPFFVTVYLCDAPSRGEARPFQQNYQVSRVSPVVIVHLQLCRELEVDPKRARLWFLENDPDNEGTPRSLTNEVPKEHTREDWILDPQLNIIEQRKRRGSMTDSSRGIQLLLELKDDETGRWPRGIDGKDWTFKKKPIQGNNAELGDGIGKFHCCATHTVKRTGQVTHTSVRPSLVGLYNMGNTCYVNSIIQCLSHTPVFREYFTSKAYLRDINTKNPLGYEGKLAHVTAVLINSIWKRFNQSAPHQPKRVSAPGSYALINAPSLTPKTFKESLGTFKEDFAGNEQHDAQEVLNFLLDGLNEELNRVIEKPYIEQPDSDGRPDSELAEIWWENHLKRELSIIVALFTGQYKSLLTCRQCNYESARFEPFSFLQVPLPEDDHLVVVLIVYPLKEGTSIMKYSVRVRADGRLRDVLIALAKVLCLDDATAKGKSMSEEELKEPDYIHRAQNLAVVDVRDGHISKIAPSSWLLHDLQNKETGELPVLQVYELVPLTGESLTYVQAQAAKNVSPQKVLKESDDEESQPDENEKSTESVKPKYGFVTVAQRRPEMTAQDFLHPFALRVFGVPLLLRIDDLDNQTGAQVYDLVAQRLMNYVPKAAQKFLMASDVLPAVKSENDSPGPHRTLSDSEEAAGGSVPRYGFRLRLTTRDGRHCCTCSWFECCIGCTVPDNDETGIVMDSDSLAVDWHFAVDMATQGFGTRSSPMDPISRQPQPTKPKLQYASIKNHHSVGVGSKNPGPGGSVTLDDCLDAFAKEERIPDTYCSKCQDLRVQTKHMSLWRVPPILIIQLKRFQFTTNMRRKLRDHVVFPVDGLDLSRFTASQDKPKENGNTSTADAESEEASDNGIKNSVASSKDDNMYDLYGVVHHQGALSAGHYVASIKSELDGHWRLFNDAQIYEIHARDVVDSSAYMLFYIRRDVARTKHLSDFWNVRAEGEGMSEEDLKNLLKVAKGGEKGCIIS